MAITDVYQDLIMNPENMPNRLQNLEMFPPNNIPGRFDAFYDSTSNQEIPGFNFVDAPTSLMSRFKNPQFLNNPRTGILDASILSRGNPQNSLFNRARSGITQGLDMAKDKLGSGLDLGRSAISGILSLVTGLPGVDRVLSGITSQFENRPLGAPVVDEFGNVYDAEALNKTNALGGYYSDQARSARRRTSRIQSMLERQKQGKKISEKNLKELLEQERQQEALQRQAIDRMFERGEGGSGQDFTGGRFDGARDRAEYDRDPTGFSGSS